MGSNGWWMKGFLLFHNTALPMLFRDSFDTFPRSPYIQVFKVLSFRFLFLGKVELKKFADMGPGGCNCSLQICLFTLETKWVVFEYWFEMAKPGRREGREKFYGKNYSHFWYLSLLCLYLSWIKFHFSQLIFSSSRYTAKPSRWYSSFQGIGNLGSDADSGAWAGG